MLATILFICGIISFSSCGSDSEDAPVQQPTVQRITERGKLLVGTTGDYRPLSYKESNGDYWGFGIEMAEKIAERLGVGIEYVQTSWPTLTADVQAEPQTFDLAIGGITITDTRKETMLMSDGYLKNGKTILCCITDVNHYHSLADINQPGVRVMVNPGGLNEKFANERLTNATIVVHQRNEEIPRLVAEGCADASRSGRPARYRQRRHRPDEGGRNPPCAPREIRAGVRLRVSATHFLISAKFILSASAPHHTYSRTPAVPLSLPPHRARSRHTNPPANQTRRLSAAC